MHTLTLPDDAYEILDIADQFCGGGGTTTGVKKAAEELGLKVRIVAVNHWKVAIATHSANHPDADHYCQAVGSVNPLRAVPGGRLRLMVASPECTGHSNARGGKPTSEQHRADAWELMRWIEELYIDNLLIENVREFQDWGPLGVDGKPLKSKKGLYFKQFVAMLEVNYKVETRILNAADYSDCTSRERFFLIARRPEHKPIVWPEPTHASREAIQQARSQPSLFPARTATLKPWRAAREIIDWSLPGHSIFLTREDVRAMGLRIKRPLSPNTVARIFAGLARYSGLSFILPHQHGSSGLGNVRSTDEPLPTVTGTSSDMFLAQPFLLPHEGFYRGNAPRSVEDPLNTITSRGAGGVVQPYLLNLKGTDRRDRSIDEPTFTQNGGNHQAVIQPFVLNIRGGEDGYTRGAGVDEPLPTVTAITPFALIEPFLVQYFGERDGQKERVRTVDVPLWTVTGQGRTGLCEADSFLVKSYTGSDAASLDEPLPTITASVEHLGLASPFLTKFHGSHKGRADGNGRTHSVEEPLPTADGSNRFGLALPFVLPVNHGKGDTRTRSVEEPLPTVTQFDALALAEPYLVKFYGTATGQSLDDPLHTVTSKERFGLALPQVGLVIPQLGIMLDIRFRMLQPHELAAATGFPRTYIFTGTRDEQVKQIGNAVPVNLAAALVRTILTSDAKPKRAKRRKAA